MTSLTYMTYAFVFVFLNVMHPSEEKCMDHLEQKLWKKELTEPFDLVFTEDPKDQIICTLQRTCIQRLEDPTCVMLRDCCGEDKAPICQDVTNNKTPPECKDRSSVKVHFFHIMCLVSQRFDGPAKACNYNHMLPKDKILPETPCSVSNLTATQNKTTLPEMSTTTTTTATPTPNARIASPTVLEAKNEDLQILLWVSLVFHVIMPVAVYLFMRHQWRRDKASYMYDGNTAENEHMVQVATPQALVNGNEHGAQLLQLVRYYDDDDDPLSGTTTHL